MRNLMAATQNTWKKPQARYRLALAFTYFCKQKLKSVKAAAWNTLVLFSLINDER